MITESRLESMVQNGWLIKRLTIKSITLIKGKQSITAPIAEYVFYDAVGYMESQAGIEPTRQPINKGMLALQILGVIGVILMLVWIF